MAKPTFNPNLNLTPAKVKAAKQWYNLQNGWLAGILGPKDYIVYVTLCLMFVILIFAIIFLVLKKELPSATILINLATFIGGCLVGSNLTK